MITFTTNRLGNINIEKMDTIKVLFKRQLLLQLNELDSRLVNDNIHLFFDCL